MSTRQLASTLKRQYDLAYRPSGPVFAVPPDLLDFFPRPPSAKLPKPPAFREMPPNGCRVLGDAW
jgi:hypothetical protein